MRRHFWTSAVVLILTLVAIASCGDNAGVKRALAMADSLMESRPDSALHILRRDSALIESSASAGYRMWYTVLRTEAEDKLYIPHYSDSTLLRVVKFYNTLGTPMQRVRSNYVLGRVYHDMRLYGSALSAFNDALGVGGDDDSTVCRYKALACGWIGGIYEDRRLYERSLKYYKLSYDYAKRSGVLPMIVYGLIMIGRNYSFMKNNKKAIPYYLKALEYTKKTDGGSLYDVVTAELANIYCEEGRYEEAKTLLPKSLEGISDVDKASLFFSWAYYYHCIGNADSAIYFNKHGMDFGFIEKNHEASLDIANIYGDMGDTSKANDYYKLRICYEDSLRHLRKIEDEDYINYVEKNLRNAKDNIELANSRTRLIVFVFALIVLLAFFVIYFANWYRRKKHLYAERHRRVVEQWEKTHVDDTENILHLETEVEQLKDFLNVSKEASVYLKEKLAIAENRLLTMNNQMLSEQNKIADTILNFERTDVFCNFHNPRFIPSHKDYKNLEELLNEVYCDFTPRIKRLYSEIQTDEIYICCLIKIGLKSKEICNLMNIRPNVLSMKRLRLYKKMFNRKGSATEFDRFVKDL